MRGRHSEISPNPTHFRGSSPPGSWIDNWMAAGYRENLHSHYERFHRMLRIMSLPAAETLDS